MALGIIGLGKMGGGIAKKLKKAGWDLFVFDIDTNKLEEFNKSGFNIVYNIQDLNNCDVIWLMVPANKVDSILEEVIKINKKNLIVIDGGNSNFNDTISRAKRLKEKNINLIDCGTSGGLYGAEHGFSMTIGGDFENFKKVEKIFKDLSLNQYSYAYVGTSGAGHYVKMIHNGIEYAIMQSYGEGFNVLHNGHYKNLDLEKISLVWSNGAIIRSYILELSNQIFKEDQNFVNISGQVDENGTGRWTVQEAKKDNIEVKLIEDAVSIRLESQKTGGNYATKLVAMLRNKVGGHTVKKN